MSYDLFSMRTGPSCYHRLYQFFSLLLHGMLFRMLVIRIWYCGYILVSHNVLSILFYSPCHESRSPWGCDRGRQGWT